jgi:hypothetical protein
MVNFRKYVVVIALAGVLALAAAAGSGAQSPEPPAPPPIPPVPSVPTLPTVPEVPDVPDVPRDPSKLTDLLTPMSAQLMLSARPARGGAPPVTFQVSGWLLPPKPVRGMADLFRKGLGLDLGLCKGRVEVRYAARGRTLATRRAAVNTTCSFTSRIAIRSRRQVRGARRLRVTARFPGNSMLAAASHSIALPLR